MLKDSELNDSTLTEGLLDGLSVGLVVESVDSAWMVDGLLLGETCCELRGLVENIDEVGVSTKVLELWLDDAIVAASGLLEKTGKPDGLLWPSFASASPGKAH